MSLDDVLCPTEGQIRKKLISDVRETDVFRYNGDPIECPLKPSHYDSAVMVRDPENGDKCQSLGQLYV